MVYKNHAANLQKSFYYNLADLQAFEETQSF